MKALLKIIKAPKVKVRKVSISPEEFLTTKELMRLLRIKHKQTVYALIEEGLPMILVGRSYRFLKSEVMALLENKTVSRNGKKRKLRK